MVEKIGVIVASPTPSRADFVTLGQNVHQGQFVEIKSKEGTFLALVEEVIKENRYFEQAEIVREYEIRKSIKKVFPTHEWEFLVATSRPLVLWKNESAHRPSVPPAPGDEVFTPNEEHLKKFLGLDEQGLHIGKIQYHNVDVRINMGKLIQKHFAVLAMSGAGKSYFVNVVIEELLKRKREQGRIGVVVFDVHGEYKGFSETDGFAEKTTIIKGDEMKIGLQQIGIRSLSKFVPGISYAQQRELERIAGDSLCEPIGLDEIIDAVESDTTIAKNVKGPLLGWLQNLKSMNVFAKFENPSVLSLIRPGKLVVFDLSQIIDMKKKQILVSYFAKRIFDLRREDSIPPTLVIIEEAHNFAPEGYSHSDVMAKPIIETIAREGRKFGLGLCLISQRPVRLSPTALSQCNTHIILRVTNPYDLDHIKQSSEGIDARSAKMITSLRPGEAIIVGAAVNFPVFVKIREKTVKTVEFEKKLEEMARDYEEKDEEIKKDVEAFS